LRSTLALIAHDSRKDDMVRLVRAHREELAEVDLVATRSTGQLVEGRTGLPVRLMHDGPLGGDLQIGASVVTGDVDAVIFLRDPLGAHSREPDISALLRVCDVHNVPLATNLMSAEAILRFVAEHPEASGRHHLAAQSLAEIGAISE
jgi:methylglyoxal synthase